MCGRKTLTKGKIEIIEELSVDDWDEEFVPSYNIAPTQMAPVLTWRNHHRVVKSMKWGLIPSWSKDMSFASKMINARSETLTIKPAFRNLISRQRGIAITDGYYEWQKTPSGNIPYYIHRSDGKLLLLAALWDTWVTPEKVLMFSYTIITNQASLALKTIHDRMPVVINPDEMMIWLNAEQNSQVLALRLLQANDTGITSYPVSSFVNNVRNNSPECLNPLK